MNLSGKGMKNGFKNRKRNRKDSFLPLVQAQWSEANLQGEILKKSDNSYYQLNIEQIRMRLLTAGKWEAHQR